MVEIQFLNISSQYETDLKKIQNTIIRKAYSEFKFLFFQYLSYNENINKSHDSSYFKYTPKYETFLINHLKRFKFISYSLSNNNLVVSAEKECIIIEQANKTFINSLFATLILQYNISVLNVEDKTKKLYKQDDQDEILNFCKYFKDEIKLNEFVKMTISSIAGYLIHRYFYPNNFFVDQSFFNYKSNSDTTDFQEEDFIFLKEISMTKKAKFSLCLHLDTFYIFFVKNILNFSYKKEIRREKYFCQICKNENFNKFYGFLKKEGEINGFVYEYMSNGSLQEYVELGKIDPNFALTAINRLYYALLFLRSCNLIHRDLKPFNILIDHNRLPYIVDFETIRQPIDANSSPEDVMTNDIGSSLYTSPEQDSEDNVSFPTDIYSFGLIVYFLIERKNFFSDTQKKFLGDMIIEKMNCSNDILNMCMKCLKLDQNERIKIEEIGLIIVKEILKQ